MRTRCYLFYHYIKPQHLAFHGRSGNGCYLFYHYIKPQRFRPSEHFETSCYLSYHYIKPQQYCDAPHTVYCCYLSYYYIKPQRRILNRYGRKCCYLSYYYIKPQPYSMETCVIPAVTYPITTSNHNQKDFADYQFELLLILLLHQTTTMDYVCNLLHRCYLSYYYIKPQRCPTRVITGSCCYLSYYYIKPQQIA